MTELFQTMTYEGGSARPLKPSLLVASGPLKGATFELGADSVTLGRVAGNTIVLPSDRVSRKHCTIRLQPNGRYALRDEGSRNGTLVNGRKVAPGEWHELVHGDSISIVETVLCLVDSREAEEAETSGEIVIDRRAARNEALTSTEGFPALRRARRADPPSS